MTQNTDTDDRASRFVTTENDGVVIIPAGTMEFEEFPDSPDGDDSASTTDDN